MEEQKKDIEQLLAQGKTLQIKPQGYSMYPMFIPGRDEAILQKAEPSEWKRGDVALYRRDQGILVLHRIYKITADGFYMVGDNQSEIEGPLRPDQLKGKLTAFIRNGKKISVKHPMYRAAARIWLAVCPVRPVLMGIAARLKKILKHC